MYTIRKALLWTSCERYSAMLINFIVMIIVARLMTPEEFGAAVLGNTVWGMAALLCEFGQANYVTQQPNLTFAMRRTAFTLSLLLTFLVCAALGLGAHAVSLFYKIPGLDSFLYVAIGILLLHSMITPALAILRREMAFGIIALITIASGLVNAIAVIWLALLGFGYMSMAWATLLSTFLAWLLCLLLNPHGAGLGFSTEDWKSVSRFGALDVSKNLLYYISDSLPYLIFGRLLSAEAVGIYQRATTISRLPERFLMAGLVPVLLPAFSRHAREGNNLKSGYLKGIEYVTGTIWPALVLVIILAKELVLLLLGDQWGMAAPYVQIIAGATLFYFQMSLTNPILIAAGRIRDTVSIAAITIPATIAVQWIASYGGLQAVALSMFLTAPFSVGVAIFFMKNCVSFEWTELLNAMKKSALVVAVTAAGPLLAKWDGSLPVSGWGGTLMLLAVGGCGWVLGLWLADHPLYREVIRGCNAVRDALFGDKQGLRRMTRTNDRVL